VFCRDHVLIRQGVRGLSNLCTFCRSRSGARYFLFVLAIAALVAVPGVLGFVAKGTPGAICAVLLGGLVGIFVAWRIMPD